MICGAPLVYFQTEKPMECAVCKKVQNSKAACANGHFVCDACHTAGMGAIFEVCIREDSKNPVAILEKLMGLDFCHMHGPEHHAMVGSALLTAYKNAGGEIDLAKALREMQARAANIPGGACGFWGACGAAISAGMFASIITHATPLADTAWGFSNEMTGRALTAIGKVGGPRCCKRNSYIAITQAVAFTKERLGVEMEGSDISCARSERNDQCLKARCPFWKNRK